MIKYPLSKKEENLLDQTWEFIYVFREPYIYLTDYRKSLIKTMRKKYTIKEFHQYETIANKLFWNLRWNIAPLFINKNLSKDEYDKILQSQTELPCSLLKCEKITYKDDEDLGKKLANPDLFNDNYYRSFINKLIFVDQNNHIIYHKLMEGSSDILTHNNFNLTCFNIFFDRNLYEEIMKDPYKIKNKYIELSNYYYQQDYGFPNLNLCTYNFNSDDEQIYRIKKMYYENKTGEFWFKLIL